MGSNFHVPHDTTSAHKPTDINAPLSSLDRAIGYPRNIIVHADGDITYVPATGVLDWAGTLRIIFNRTDGQAIENTVATGNITLNDNEFAYVDLNETDATVLTMQKASITTASASNFILFNRVVMGYRNTASDDYYAANLFPVGGASGGGGSSPLTTKGDIYTFSTVDARLAVGASLRHLLRPNSGTSTGLEWFKPVKQANFSIAKDADGWGSEGVPIWIAPKDYSVTITQISAAVLGITSPALSFNIEERAFASLNSAGTDVFASDQSADADGIDITSFANAGIAAKAHLVFTTDSAAETGTVDFITGAIYYTED